MAGQKVDRISRRAVVLGLALAAAHRSRSARAQVGPASPPTLPADQPLFSPAGPNAELYGAADHYPVPGFVEARWHGNPFAQRYRVGAFSHADDVYGTKRIRRADEA